MKNFVAGCLFAFVLMFTSLAFADGLQKIEAYLRPDLAITLDGNKLVLESSPIIYDGSTYLPLRETASILGLQVGWNEQSQTAELVRDSNPNQLTSPKFGFENVIEQSGSYYIDCIEIMNKSVGLYFDPDLSTKKLKLRENNQYGKILVEEVPFKHLNVYWAIEYNYYLEHIKPLEK